MAVVLGVCVAALLSLLVDRSPLIWMLLLAGIALALVVSAANGWLGGPRAIHRATWSSDGRWWLIDGRGAAFEARLLADSRVFAHCLWLRWDSPAGRRQAFLARRGLQSDVVRRLGVRLRLQGVAVPGPDDSPL